MFKPTALTALLAALAATAAAVPVPSNSSVTGVRNTTVTAAAALASLGGPDEPQSCLDEAKALCGHCHFTKSCWASCAQDHESELRAAGCVTAVPLLGQWLGAMNATAVTLGDPLTNAACYEISGGFTKIMGVSGQYQRMAGGSTATNPVCGGRSIWKNGDSYIYSYTYSHSQCSGCVSWCVGNAAQMGACACDWNGASDAGAYLTNGHGTGDSPDTNTGKWWAHTGAGTSFGQCDDASKPDQGNSGWCGDAGIKVVAC
eukprot:COSAG06_NODE_103_length_23904_cov_10.413401_2_plen_259_part_00